MRRYETGDPVGIVTGRELEGWVTGVERPDARCAVLLPQSFKGVKGWIEAMQLDRTSREPASYRVVFPLRGHLRSVRLYRISEEPDFEPRATCEGITQGRGHLEEVHADDLEADGAPQERFEEFRRAGYAGTHDLDLWNMLVEAAEILEARDAALDPGAYLQRLRREAPEADEQDLQRHLYRYRVQWRVFQKEGWPSVLAAVQTYIEGEDTGHRDWTPLFAAVDQADHGDRSVFDALMGEVFEQTPVAEYEFHPLREEFAPVADTNGDPDFWTIDCFDCGTVMPGSEAWSSRQNPDLVLCGDCRVKREATARARRARHSRGRGGFEPGSRPTGSLPC